MNIPESKIEQFHRDGYFVLESVIPDEHLDLLRRVCQSAIESKNAEMDAQGTDVIGISHRDQRYFIRAMPNFPELRDFTLGDLMASIGRSILGDTIYFKSDQYVVKYGSSEMSFSWHQDSGYAQKRIGDHPELMGCWCTLDDVSEENGTVYFLPKQRFGAEHKGGHAGGPRQAGELVDADEAEALVDDAAAPQRPVLDVLSERAEVAVDQEGSRALRPLVHVERRLAAAQPSRSPRELFLAQQAGLKQLHAKQLVHALEACPLRAVVADLALRRANRIAQPIERRSRDEAALHWRTVGFRLLLLQRCCWLL